MFDSNHPILGSQHADVLSAEPETEEAKRSLVEELMNRARAVFSVGNFPIAEILYDKAIKVKSDEAVLYANRSAARLQLNMADAALEDADKAIALDASYSKAFYRKGQAHNARKEFDAAVAAFEKGLQLDPSNKTFADMAAKAKAAAAKAATENAGKAAAEAAASTPSTSSSSSSFSSSSSASTPAAPAPPRKPKAGGSGAAKTKGAGSDDEDEATLKAEELRGYKVLADGRKTTYFNNELSDEAKRLIGDIAPKKIDPAEAAPQQPNGAGAGTAGGGAGTSGSAWNYAGTFEERNMTEWAKDKLKELLGGVSFVIPSVGAVVDVVKVSGLEGDASVTFVRGKKKYLFDFVFTLEWEAELDCGKAKGSLKYPDVTPDNDDEYDTLLEVDPLTPPEARPLINAYVKADGDGVQKVVKEKLREFMREFMQF